MWDKDTWPNNNGNTSVKLLWLFGLMECSHRWPSAGLKSITDMPSHMIRFAASGAAANTRFILFIYLFIFGHPRSRTVRCVERLVPPRAAQEWQLWLVLSCTPRPPPHPLSWGNPGPQVGLKVMKKSRQERTDTWLRVPVDWLLLWFMVLPIGKQQQQQRFLHQKWK